MGREENQTDLLRGRLPVLGLPQGADGDRGREGVGREEPEVSCHAIMRPKDKDVQVYISAV